VKNTIIAVVGKKGSGKSSLAEKVCRRLLANHFRLIVVEPHGDGFNFEGVPDISGEDAAEFESLRGRSCVVRAQCLEAAHNAFVFVWHAQEGSSVPVWLVVDEAQLYLNPHRPDEQLLQIIQFGRHRMISCLFVTQRPAHCHKDMFAQADRRVIFTTSEPNDLDYIRKYTGVDPERVQKLRMPAPGRRIGEHVDV